MKHIKKFESYGTKEVSKVNEEFDFAALTDIYNGFVQWLQSSHFDGTGDLVGNWETVAGVLGALGLSSPLWFGAIKHNKEMKDQLNKVIAKKIQENPDKDPKEIAAEVEAEFKN